MARSKYAKYLRPLSQETGRIGEKMGRFFGARDFEDSPFYFVWHPIPVLKEPLIMIKSPHSHDFDQYLGFFGTDPYDAESLGEGVDIELYLGEEEERFRIDRPQMVYLPAGLMHGPLIFKIVKTPFVFLDMLMTPDFQKSSSSTKR